MAKSITLRVDDSVYNTLKRAADCASVPPHEPLLEKILTQSRQDAESYAQLSCPLISQISTDYRGRIKYIIHCNSGCMQFFGCHTFT